MTYVWFLLIYLLTGILFLLCYILALRPQTREVQLGLIALFWPLILLIDIVLALSTQFGAVGNKLAQRFRKG